LVRYVVTSRERRRLIQDDLVVKARSRRRIVRVINIAPRDIEYTVRRSARYGGERPTGGTGRSNRILIYPVRSDRIGGRVHRHTGDVKEVVGGAER